MTIAFTAPSAASIAPSPLSVALDLAARGFATFPCQPAGDDRKRPQPGVMWRSAASRDADRIEKWWRIWPDAMPAIDLSKTDFVVIDCDRAKSPGQADGIAWFDRAMADHGYEPIHVPIVATPSGGKHFYFRQPPGPRLGNGRGSLPKSSEVAIDVRGAGGFTIAPGSMRDDGPYVLVDPGCPIEDAPELPAWLASILRGEAPTPEPIKLATGAAGQQIAVAPGVGRRERAYAGGALDDEAREVAGTGKGGRNDRLNLAAYNVGQYVGAGWLAEAEAVEALTNAARTCGLESVEIRKTIRSGLEAGKSNPAPPLPVRDDGTASVDLAQQFVAAHKAEKGEVFDGRSAAPGPAPRSFPFTLFRDIDPAPRKSWMVEYMIGDGDLSVIYGPPGCGKSAIAGDLACHVAAGLPWMGRRTVQGAVLYVAAERAKLVERRFAAWRRHHGIHDLPIAVISGVFDLTQSKADAAAIVETVRQVERATGTPVRWIVVDTKAQVLSGDENSAKDVSALVQNVERIKAATGAGLTLIDHSAYYSPEKMRGSTALLGAADVTLMVKRDGAVRTVEAMKANDGEDGVTLATVRFESVTVSTDPETGKETTAPVVLPAEDEAAVAPGPNKRGPKLSPSERRALDMLRKAVVENGEKPAPSNHIPEGVLVVSEESWRAYTYAGGISAGETKDAQRKAFRRAATALVNHGLVGLWGDSVWIARDDGTLAAQLIGAKTRPDTTGQDRTNVRPCPAGPDRTETDTPP